MQLCNHQMFGIIHLLTQNKDNLRIPQSTEHFHIERLCFMFRICDWQAFLKSTIYSVYFEKVCQKQIFARWTFWEPPSAADVESLKPNDHLLLFGEKGFATIHYQSYILYFKWRLVCDLLLAFLEAFHVSDCNVIMITNVISHSF